jgi:hypothetical protein
VVINGWIKAKGISFIKEEKNEEKMEFTFNGLCVDVCYGVCGSADESECPGGLR